MAFEIEHKFLLKNEDWRILAKEKFLYQQAYISTYSGTTVRIRVIGDIAFLTLKGKISGELGISRSEFEYEIPVADAKLMLSEYVDSPLVEKYRYHVHYENKTWEIDEFIGENAGLLVAEIELESENETFSIPSWIGECVSGDGRYTNASLAHAPYGTWEQAGPVTH